MLVWACEKFSRYLCGLESFQLMTDQDLDRVPLKIAASSYVHDEI